MRYRIRFIGLLAAIMFIFTGGQAIASLELTIKPQFVFNGRDSYIDTTAAPVYRILVKAKQNSTKINLGTENILIMENNRIAQPFAVGSPDIDGWQSVSWYTVLGSTTGGYDPDNGWQSCLVIGIYKNEIARQSIDYYLYSISKIKITDLRLLDSPEFYWGNVPPGSKKEITVNVSAVNGKKKDDYELPVRVDSVRTHTPNFTLNWRGAIIDKTPPPVGIISPFDYKVDLTYQANDDKYHTDKLTVYYEGGRKEEVNLIANKFDVERKTVLNLVQPNGGEVLTPCQRYTIKWVGSVRNLPTIVEYSNNGGTSWNHISNVEDSSYVWTVPKDISDSVMIRVRQEFNNSEEHLLKVSNVPVRRLAYRSDAAMLLAFNEEGKIHEWNLASFTLANTYNLNINYPGERAFPFGLEYIDSDKQFIAGYYKSIIFTGSGENNLAFFEAGKPDPVRTIALDSRIRAKKMVIDSKKQILALMSEMGTQLSIISATDGSLIKTVDFPYPVTSVSFSSKEDKALVALLNGEVRVMSVPDFSEIRTMNFSGLPIILETSLSPNGELLSIGCMAPVSTINVGNKNEIHVIDIASGQIIRTVRNTASNPVGLEFNPSSNVLVVGSQALPQISLWDLPSNDYIGALSGSEGMLTDFRFSPEGHSIAVSSASMDNLTVRTFTYPEFDLTDGMLRIVRPEIKISGINAGQAYIATVNGHEYSAQFCNTGIVPFIIENSWLKYNIHFHMMEPAHPDTVFPGECKTIKMVFFPVDTGRLADTLYIISCNETFAVPVEGYSMPRHISFYKDIFDFGELCMGEAIDKEILLARNDDPVPLKVNLVVIDDQVNSPFTVMNFPNDTILAPGGSISVNVRFKPNQLGDVLRRLVVRHSDLGKYFPDAMIKGFGIGAIIESSHNDLRFIPEQQSRKIIITNKSNKEVKIEKALFVPKGVYEIVTQLPVTLAPGEQGEIEIRHIGQDTADAALHLEATPCAAQNDIVLGLYKALSTVSIPLVQADPRGGATIPVSFETTENMPYKGTRSFETEIKINPRMFLPQTVTSSFGSAEIVRNEIVDDKRVIGIRVEGDFANKGVAAEIHGQAGLAETAESAVEFNKQSVFWGQAVRTNALDGTFRIVNVCGEMYLSQKIKTVTIMSVSPNPASEYVNVEFKVEKAGQATIELFDFTGSRVAEPITIDARPGTHTLPISATGISTGTYKLVVRQGADFDAAAVVVVR